MVHRPFIFAVLLAGIFLVPAVRAQPAVRKVDNRFLLIFDTSSDMKRRLPAVQKALNDILVASTNGQLHPGDSIGVWTFDQELQAGQFPLQHWEPDNAAVIASNINAFVGKQRYTKTTRFDALLPLLNQVVRSSERLTVLIFCDGNGEIHGTPYDVGINQDFSATPERTAEGAVANRHRVALATRPIRRLHGEFPAPAGEFSAVSAIAQRRPRRPVPPPAPPPPASPCVPPLIIVGTTITNHVPPPAPKPVPANPADRHAVITSTPAPVVTNEVKPPIIVPLMQTGAVPAQPKIAAAPLTTTNAIAPPSESSEMGRKECFGPWRGISGGGGWPGGFHVSPRPQDRRRQPRRRFDEKGLIPPVTFDRGSGKFPSMKAWIYIYAIVFAAGMVTVWLTKPKPTRQPAQPRAFPPAPTKLPSHRQ